MSILDLSRALSKKAYLFESVVCFNKLLIICINKVGQPEQEKRLWSLRFLFKIAVMESVHDVWIFEPLICLMFLLHCIAILVLSYARQLTYSPIFCLYRISFDSFYIDLTAIKFVLCFHRLENCRFSQTYPLR